MNILYITYIDFGNFTSGSMVRPQKIYDAFLKSGHNIKLLKGQQNIGSKEREKNVDEINKWLDNNKPDLCYIESSTYPILNGYDRKLIKRINKMGVKIGYFLRDAYYKFPKEVYEKDQNIIKKIKKLILKLMYLNDEKLLKKYASIVYLPTIKMSTYFNFKNIKILPPAGENLLQKHNFEDKTCIYVGGVSGLYGGNLLLKSFQLLNKQCSKYKLILVCRESELKYIDKEILENATWLEIHHVSSQKNLAPLYKRTSIALLPRLSNKYSDLSISVKFFEYMSYGLPIVAMYAEEMSKIIKKYDIGIVTENNEDCFSKAISDLFSDENLYKSLCNNVENALLNNNLWQHRVEQIIENLS